MAGGTGECYLCGKEFPLTKLKKCSRCFLVKYCSKECQKGSWKLGHKKTCKPHPQSNNPKPPVGTPEWMELEIDKQLSRWIETWRSVLCRYATFALDMANHPPDRNLTHWMVIWVNPRHPVDNPAQNYGMVKGEIMACSDIRSKWPALEIPNWSEHNRMRFILVLETNGELRRVRSLTWQTPEVDFYRNMSKEASKLLAEDWENMLILFIEHGDVRTVERSLGCRQD